MMPERWKPITGYETRYEVSNYGDVKSLPFMQRGVSKNGLEYYRRTNEKILSQQLINSGYFIVHLWLDNVRIAFTVHRLVAKAFVQGSGDEVNHEDGDKRNNCDWNLKWMSSTGNKLHAVAAGLNSQAVRVKHPETAKVYVSIAQAAKATAIGDKIIRKYWERM
jgi:hypothetical protein